MVKYLNIYISVKFLIRLSYHYLTSVKPLVKTIISATSEHQNYLVHLGFNKSNVIIARGATITNTELAGAGSGVYTGYYNAHQE